MLSLQTDITAKMRGILVDWLVDVHLKFKLRTETLYMTINLVDRYLSHNLIHRTKLQLVGVAAMFIACKYEEIYAPVVQDFVYIVIPPPLPPPATSTTATNKSITTKKKLENSNNMKIT